MRRCVLMVVGMLALASPSAAIAAKDDAQTALNIIPSGQQQLLGPGSDVQANMYDGLTPLFDNVTNADLTNFFKSERLGIDNAGPGTNESVPRPGVTITRDKFDVPHVKGATHDDGVWASGWIAAEDRGLLLNQARYNARIAVIDAPGLSAIGAVLGLHTFVPSQQTEDATSQEAQALQDAGKEGNAVLHDIDTFISGINDYNAAHSPGTPTFTRNDIFAINALKAQFLGQGGGGEALRSQFLGGLEQRLGTKKGLSVFNDLRQFKNPESPTTVDGKFNYGRIPKKAKGSVVLDPGSFNATPSVTSALAEKTPSKPVQASNTLMIDKKHSATGNPLMVGGPQIGYNHPGLTYEIDMDAGDLQWRGATSAPFPGYLLIGRGPDFATTLTSASGDIIDQFAEKLCGGSDTKYEYKGQCRAMGHFDAGTYDGKPVSFNTTVHGPVEGYATVNGTKMAISSQRSDRGEEALDLLYNRRLSNGQVHSPKSFFNAANLTPQTFNSFYIDNKHTAEFTAGLQPIRNKNVDPGLPTLGTGKFEWKGFLSKNKHMHGTDPNGGTMVNWNNSVAHGWGAADDEFGRNGSAMRVDMLSDELQNLKKKGKWTLASVTSAMNAAATQDVRAIDTVPLLSKLLKGSSAPSPQAQTMLALLVAWHNNGGSRLDRDLDGKIDDPGAAIMDSAWPKIADALMSSRLGPQLDELDSLFARFDSPPGGQYNGWYQYFDRDVRSLLGKKVKKPFNNAYCGGGNLSKCQQSMWSALASAGSELTIAQGTSDPSAWRADATAERIHFTPIPVVPSMRYTNRPTGIQQVISFNKHG